MTRDIANVSDSRSRYLEDPHFHCIEGDIRDFAWPTGDFPYVIHAATTRAEETFHNQDALTKYDTLASGTRHVLEFAAQANTKKLLWTSSGACYGKQPSEMRHIPEDYHGGPDPLSPEGSALGLGKRSAEFLCAYYSQRYGFEVKIARCFTFVGPRLQMDIHYAIGNFIRSAVQKNPITVTGDGTPIRSYMYITDLIIWLFNILERGQSLRAYNVGSDVGVSIAELAQTISQTAGGLEIEIKQEAQPGVAVNRYLPDITRAQTELGLRVQTPLARAVQRTLSYERGLI